jgi:hypothetical protein
MYMQLPFLALRSLLQDPHALCDFFWAASFLVVD